MFRRLFLTGGDDATLIAFKLNSLEVPRFKLDVIFLYRLLNVNSQSSELLPPLSSHLTRSRNLDFLVTIDLRPRTDKTSSYVELQSSATRFPFAANSHLLFPSLKLYSLTFDEFIKGHALRH